MHMPPSSLFKESKFLVKEGFESQDENGDEDLPGYGLPGANCLSNRTHNYDGSNVNNCFQSALSQAVVKNKSSMSRSFEVDRFGVDSEDIDQVNDPSLLLFNKSKKYWRDSNCSQVGVKSPEQKFENRPLIKNSRNRYEDSSGGSIESVSKKHKLLSETELNLRHSWASEQNEEVLKLRRKYLRNEQPPIRISGMGEDRKQITHGIDLNSDRQYDKEQTYSEKKLHTRQEEELSSNRLNSSKYHNLTSSMSPSNDHPHTQPHHLHSQSTEQISTTNDYVDQMKSSPNDFPQKHQTQALTSPLGQSSTKEGKQNPLEFSLHSPSLDTSKFTNKFSPTKSIITRNSNSNNFLSSHKLEKDEETSVQFTEFVQSCVVELPQGAVAGDIVKICWPRIDQVDIIKRSRKPNEFKRMREAVPTKNKCKTEKYCPARSGMQHDEESDNNVEYLGDSGRSTTLLDLCLSPTELRNKTIHAVCPPLFVRMTISSKLTLSFKSQANKNKRRYVKVFAPWIAAKRSSAASLTSRQLMSIGITGRDDEKQLRRSRRDKQKRRYGEGTFVSRSVRIGDRYQISKSSIPSCDTWRKEQLIKEQLKMGKKVEKGAMMDTATAQSDQIWDRSLSDAARNRGEPLEKYLDSLHMFQRARGMITLHQSSYKVALAERRFQKKTLEKVPFLDPPTSQHQQLPPQLLLEGMPLSLNEQTNFHEAILEHRKQLPVIAEAVGTSVNRCIIHYYSSYKSGEKYTEFKKLMEQSDKCEVCHDGGNLICCDRCDDSFHMWCVWPPLLEIPQGKWFCDKCQRKQT